MALQYPFFFFFPILPATAAKQCIKLDILATSLLYLIQFATYFLNSLTQYANLFKIRQIYNTKKAFGGLLADFEKISILYI